MTWTAKYERTFKYDKGLSEMSLHFWRSDQGVWGYYHDVYDGLHFYCIGLGRLFHICWGDSVD